MSTERDPRTDPRPGDVLELDGLEASIVVRMAGERIVVCRSESEPGRDLLATAGQWRGLMAGARVLARGEEADHAR